MRIHCLLLLCLACLMAPAGVGLAQETNESTKVEAQKGLKYQSTVLEGMKVWNPQGEELGEVADLMIDVDSGQVTYAAVEHGGVAGVGGKMVAVPWKALKVKQAKGEYFLELNVPKEKFESIEGFDDKNWPAEPNKELISAAKG